MDQYSFQGPYAYRWVGDVPVERIDLRSGERRDVRIGQRRSSARQRRRLSAAAAKAVASEAHGPAPQRALMAAWN